MSGNGQQKFTRWATKKTHGQPKVENWLPKGQIGKKVSVEHCIWHSSDFGAVTEECHMALLGGKGLIQSIALTSNSVFFLTLTIFFLVFRDSQNENSQLKYAQRELLDKLEAQQKEFDTKQSVSSAQSK